MRLAVSNIGWIAEQDEVVYRVLNEHNFEGLEIAPTRIFPEHPYKNTEQVRVYADQMSERYGLKLCSMQSIWFGMTQRIAESERSYRFLLDYTEQAARFAQAAGCRNLVFGCPKNRNLLAPSEAEIVERFLKDGADVAGKYGVILALEANPAMYQTNFVNTTCQAIELLERINHPALMLNLDFGTIVANGERFELLADHAARIAHVHISEPGLKPLNRRKAHEQLRNILEKNHYDGFISLEMGKTENPDALFDSLRYLKEVFG